MTTVLIVDGSPAGQRAAATLLRRAGIATTLAASGPEAIARLREGQAQLVLTDVDLPETNGLNLLRHVREHYPALPIILMAGAGNDKTIVAGLQAGAASYVPQQDLEKDLVKTVRHVLELARDHRDKQDVLGWLERRDSHFVLGSEFRHGKALVGYLLEQFGEMNLAQEDELLFVGMALHEALCNAIEHGNLELDSALRMADGGYHRHAEQRRRQQPYCDRRVYVTAQLTRDEAKVTIRDEGPGFDASRLPDPGQPENLERVGGRGLMLIRSFMDHVSFNEQGNEITLIKRRKRSTETLPMAGSVEARRLAAANLAGLETLVAWELQGSVVVVSPLTDLGELDYSRLDEAFRDVLKLLEDGRATSVVLDFAHTNYFGSNAIGLFIRIWKRARQNNGSLAVCHLSDVERAILQTAGLSKIWPVCRTREEALQEIAEA